MLVYRKHYDVWLSLGRPGTFEEFAKLTPVLSNCALTVILIRYWKVMHFANPPEPRQIVGTDITDADRPVTDEMSSPLSQFRSSAPAHSSALDAFRKYEL